MQDKMQNEARNATSHEQRAQITCSSRQTSSQSSSSAMSHHSSSHRGILETETGSGTDPHSQVWLLLICSLDAIGQRSQHIAYEKQLFIHCWLNKEEREFDALHKVYSCTIALLLCRRLNKGWRSWFAEAHSRPTAHPKSRQGVGLSLRLEQWNTVRHKSAPTLAGCSRCHTNLEARSPNKSLFPT